ncbi:MAG TPA: hypothetical protein VGZ02_04805 [Candidatus Baltobacteraceae bacterium]|nr:hypothetical protein [Candidatus Baltobacteraceae bacterium]
MRRTRHRGARSANRTLRVRLSLLIPIAFLAGSAAARLALLHHPSSIAPDLAQPLPVVTYWKTFGGTMAFTLFGALAIATIAYVAVLRRVDATPRRGARAAMVYSALACAAALTFPVVFSSDVYAYAGYGDLALHGTSPYAHVRVTASDPLLAAMIWQWGNPPPMCVYGPAFVWLAQLVVATLLPLGAAAPLWALRVIACASLVSCAPLAYAAFDRFGERTRAAAAAGIALNPLAVWNAAAGHNDALALAAVLGGFVLASRVRIAAGAAAVALSTLIKAPALLACAGMLVAAWPDRARFNKTSTGAVCGILIAVALCAPLTLGVHAHLAPEGKYAPQFSPQYVLATVFPVWIAAAIVAIAAGVLIIAGVMRLAANQRSGALCAALAIWIAIPNPYPWYALWLLPVAFLAWDSLPAWAIVATSLTIALRFYPEATWANFPTVPAITLTLLMFAIPIAFLIAYTRDLARPDRREIHTTAPDFAQLRSP